MLYAAKLVLLATALHSVFAARAPDDGSVNFEPVESVDVNRVESPPREGRQSVLGCLKGCTRELRPVRGEQGGRNPIFPNKCTFDIAACRANRNRQAPLFLSQDQSNIVWPS